MMKNQKVLFFIQSRVGGAERVTVTLSKFLIESGFEVIYVIIGNDNQIFDILPEECKTHRVKIYHQRLLGIWRFYNIMRKESPHYVFSSIIYINIRVLLAAKLLGIKAIVRNNITLVNRKIEEIPLMRVLYPYAKWIIAQQEEMKNELVEILGLPSDRIKVFHNPLAVDVIEKKSKCDTPYSIPNSINFLWCARFAPEKGQDILLESFKIVLEKLPFAHLYLVGEMNKSTPFYEKISLLLDNNDYRGHVHLIGYDDNPYKWMKYCSCYVMPSRLEGLPNSLIEALYLKRPVVATNCIPIINRIVNNGKNGYVVNSENVEELADAMIRALDLRDIKMYYQPISKDDFIEIFN